MDRKLAAAAALALTLHLVMGLAFIRSSAPTYDEPVHLASGYSYLSTGRYAMNILDHPPLAEMAAALPLLALRLNDFSGHPYFLGARPYHYGDLFLYQNTAGAEKMLNAARVFCFLLWGGVFAVFIFLAARAAAGPEAGAYALMVFALLPVFISNDALVTTDAAPAALFFAAFCLGAMFCREGVQPEAGKDRRNAARRESGRSYLHASLAGAVTGLAMAAKFSMFIVPPMMVGLWALHELTRPKPDHGRLARFSALYLAVALLALALVYRSDLGLYFDGLRETFRRLDLGRSSFAWGTYSVTGVWWYFPFALAVKMPPAALLLALAGLALALARFKKEYLWLLLPPLCYFASALAAKVQIGFRHIMPVMPFLAVFAGLGAAYLKENKALLWLFVPLFALWGWGLARTWPYYLEYFSEFAGGPARGYEYLVDSNLDWGQGLKPLGAWLKSEGEPPVMLSYFGVAKPEYYGIKYFPLRTGWANVEMKGTGVDVCALERPLLAVSATNLQGVYNADKGVFAWLKDKEPLYRAGFSIFLYDLTGDRARLEKLAGLFDSLGHNREADCLYRKAK